MNYVIAMAVLLNIVSFIWGALAHFEQKKSAGYALVSSLSLIGFVGVLYYSLINIDQIRYMYAVALMLQISALGVFWASVQASRDGKLSLVFGDHGSNAVMTSGIYVMVRHPFYCAYILFWLSGLLISEAAIIIVTCVSLVAIYIFAAVKEEKQILQSHQSESYKEYVIKTGMFFPRVFRKY